MTDEDIMRIAHEAGWDTGDSLDDCVACSRFDLKDFAALVAAAEREAIIDIIEEYRISLPVLRELKDDIRARREK